MIAAGEYYRSHVHQNPDRTNCVLHLIAEIVADTANFSPEIIRTACIRGFGDVQLGLGVTCLCQAALNHPQKAVREVYAALGPTETGL